MQHSKSAVNSGLGSKDRKKRLRDATLTQLHSQMLWETVVFNGYLLFLVVQIPLLQTLPGTSTGGRALRWYSLLRRTGSQHITGDLQVCHTALASVHQHQLANTLTRAQQLPGDAHRQHIHCHMV